MTDAKVEYTKEMAVKGIPNIGGWFRIIESSDSQYIESWDAFGVGYNENGELVVVGD